MVSRVGRRLLFQRLSFWNPLSSCHLRTQGVWLLHGCPFADPCLGLPEGCWLSDRALSHSAIPAEQSRSPPASGVSRPGMVFCGCHRKRTDDAQDADEGRRVRRKTSWYPEYGCGFHNLYCTQRINRLPAIRAVSGFWLFRWRALHPSNGTLTPLCLDPPSPILDFRVTLMNTNPSGGVT